MEQLRHETHQRWICGGFAVVVCFIMLLGSAHEIPQHGVVVINTWPFVNATRAGFKALHGRGSALDAITRGCNRCEVDQCDFTVGYGGSPDSNGETTLDAMILDGSTMEMGAVAQLRRVKPAIEVARAVMEHSAHSILAGNGALAFAKMMGFEETPLDTPHSREVHHDWLNNKCQPNYFRNVAGQNASCPPYKPLSPQSDVFTGIQGQSLLRESTSKQNNVDVESLISKDNHDTIGMVVLGQNGHMAAGTSSNGATHKIAG
jgi:N4-(beta-N-acetylglucosaminyl)-L-asparaginase